MTAAPEPTLEQLLEGCAREPIHIPEAVQTFGIVLAVDAEGTVVVASGGAAHALGADAVLGRRVDEVLGLAELPAPGVPERHDLAPLGRVELRTAGTAAAGPGGAPLTLLELEVVADEVVSADELAPAQLAVARATSLGGLLDELVREVRHLLGFDRVMAYRFDPEWNGEVVAEARRADLEAYLGLRYPASDIPEQARALYRRTPSRLIADVHDPTVPLEHHDPGVSAPVDLSDCGLRSVSPVHLEYLANMGVRASMSLSIVVGGELWGLVACHGVEGPHRPAPDRRRAAEAVAASASARLGALLDAERLTRRVDAGEALAAVRVRVEGADDVAAALVAGPDVRALLGASGVTVELTGSVASSGVTGELDEARRLAARAGRSLWSSHELGASRPGGPAGALVVPVGDDGWITWWRPELVEEVRWAGDPRGKVVAEDERVGVRLGPRRSFDAYVERVTGRSRRWDDHDRWAATEVARRVADALGGRRRVADAARSAVRQVLDAEGRPAGAVEVAVRSRPAGDDPAGGDWYDVVPLPGGSVAVVVGDVAGHGFGTAGAMAQLRHALRAYLVAHRDGPTALALLDELVQHLLPGQVATAVVCVLDPAVATLQVATTGHLPPVLVGPGSAATVAVSGSPAVGLRRQRAIGATEVAVADDQVVLLYSDGLIERRGQRLDAGLAELLADLGRVDDVAVEAVAEAAMGERAATATDDLTVVAFRPVRSASPTAGAAGSAGDP